MANLDKVTLEKLAEPFDPSEIDWKPQATNRDKTKALAVAYIDARAVAERLDQVVEGDWAFDWEQGDNGSVKGKLTICGTTRCDVGEPGDGPQGKTPKAAVSDALKRSAVLFGVGRYLYRLPAQWLAYDESRKKFTQKPKLPDWAIPGRKRPIIEHTEPSQQEEAEDTRGAGDGHGDPTSEKSHWIKDERVRGRFWAWTTKMALNDNEVHEALKVEHVRDYAGSMVEAKDQIIAYVNRKAARDPKLAGDGVPSEDLAF